jgi:hypothetical protein
LHLQELSSDSSQHVRSALASVIMGMAPVLGKVRAMMLFPLTSAMFTDKLMCLTFERKLFHVFIPMNVKYFKKYISPFHNIRRFGKLKQFVKMSLL